MANVMIDIAAEFVGNKAFKQADTATDKLTKNVKKLAGAFGLAFGATAVLAYGKAAVKAAAADEKAQKQLALALKNVGLGRDAASSEAYIQRLQSEFGILDDDLRPAYQTLAVAVQDTNEAQRLLNLALDISASTGKDLGSVTAALSRAYLGNNTALSKLGVGISKADLKSKSFKSITDELTTTFAGSATAAANSYQGSIDKLSVASANAAETIGGGLIEAMQMLGGENGIDQVTTAIDELSVGISETIVATAKLVTELQKLPVVGSFLQNIFSNPLSLPKEFLVFGKGGLLDAFREYGKVASVLDYTAASSATAFEKGFGSTAKIVKNAKVLTAQEQKQLKAKQLKLAIDKANLALGKGTEVFDLEKIQLEAAKISQAEQLGKITNQAQLLQVTNDLARLRVKESILALDEAIASGDVKAITAATNKLNADLGILGALNGQALKLADIKTILNSIAPKDLINLENLNQAIRLLGVIGGGGQAAAVSAGAPPVMPSSLNPIAGAGGVRPSRGFTNEELTYFEARDQYQFGGSLSGLTPTASTAPVNITVNTGVGDPNAIAEAIDDVLRQARSRGTLVALP
jgi:hypothetical protein